MKKYEWFEGRFTFGDLESVLLFANRADHAGTNPSVSADVSSEIIQIARELKRIDEANCNYGETKRRETRAANLEKRAAEIAKEFGFVAHHQSDPRGASLFFHKQGENYHYGIAF